MFLEKYFYLPLYKSCSNVNPPCLHLQGTVSTQTADPFSEEFCQPFAVPRTNRLRCAGLGTFLWAHEGSVRLATRHTLSALTCQRPEVWPHSGTCWSLPALLARVSLTLP